jgi:hypothetical protein
MDVRRAMHTFPDEPAFELLKQLRVRYLVLHEQLLGADVYRTHVDALEKRADLERHGPFQGEGGASIVFVIDRNAK